MRLYQFVGKKARFPKLQHVIAVLSESILHGLALQPQFLHLNELQLCYKICWQACRQADRQANRQASRQAGRQADSIFFPVAVT
jgi:hypothetical protein